MGRTLAEKILARCSGQAEVKPGDIIIAKVDCAMLDDTLGPPYVDPGMKKLGAQIWDKSKNHPYLRSLHAIRQHQPGGRGGIQPQMGKRTAA